MVISSKNSSIRAISASANLGYANNSASVTVEMEEEVEGSAKISLMTWAARSSSLRK
jgi:hypothetical protein